ncbi:hypothetical protein NLI96_g3133 [Meripilus lineatus]|uniref:Uncharacterized protein n=1 Tax=Meripilus lineatus TaxID=2056292 RepID=A0AAD5V791_9APHY|nr:hypothetical protein NLI96_g3133 [Physisporinus lineatus]
MLLYDLPTEENGSLCISSVNPGLNNKKPRGQGGQDSIRPPSTLHIPAMGAVTVDVPIDQMWEITSSGVLDSSDWINPFFQLSQQLSGLIRGRTSQLRYQALLPLEMHKVELILGVVIVGVTLILRTYALYQRNNKVLTLMVSVSAVLIAMACWASIGEESEINITHGCQWGLPVSAEIRGAVAWEALFVFDTMIFILTMFKTLKGRYQYLVGVSAVTELIFRDGAIYYAVMACANAANTATFYVLQVREISILQGSVTDVTIDQPQLKGGLTYFATSISSTMISRLMLNIRQQISQPGPSSFSLVSETESVQFTSHIVSQSIIHMEDAQHRLQNMGLESLELPERGPQRV